MKNLLKLFYLRKSAILTSFSFEDGREDVSLLLYQEQ